jgi:glycerol-3-phosphate dehydrogenase
LKMRAGMILYDLLSFDKSLPKHRMLSARETLEAEPALRSEGLQGAATYFDAQIESPERLTVENITDARAHGAECFNYTQVVGGLHEGGRMTGVRVRDVVSGDELDLRARVVVNASGPWFDRVESVIEPGTPASIRTTKGVHLACTPNVRRAVVLFSGVDQRLFFVIPLRDFSWVSTTDTDFEDDPSTVSSTADDVEYLLRSASPYVPALKHSEVFWTNSGVRALVKQGGSESSVSRSHAIKSTPGLVAILGGKITGYRAIAEEATDAVARQLGVERPCVTAQQKLPGTKSATEEQVVHLADYMMRRTSLSFSRDQGRSVVREVAATLAVELGWPDAVRDREVLDYLQLAESLRPRINIDQSR